MLKFLALAALVLLVTPAPAAPAPAPGPEIAQVQRHLAAAQTMTADFTQTDRAGKTLGGTMTLKKPGRIRFQYETGVPFLIVGDGSSLYFIDYSVKQVSRWPIADSPLGVLLDPSKDLSRVASVVAGSDPRLLSVEARDPKHPEYGRITLVFARSEAAPAGLMLQGWVALDSQNNRTTIRLSNQKFNATVRDTAFRWTDPRRQPGRN